MKKDKIIIVGGGVVGVCCALQLLGDGHDVTLIERDNPGEGATRASCGSLAVSEIIPLSKPGILVKAPGWLMDPAGPLTIRLTSALQIAPWFMKFAGNARPSRVAKISNLLSKLTSTARQDFKNFLEPIGLQDLVGNRPVIELYETESDLAQERPHHDARRAHGFILEEISGAEAAEMEPSIARDFAKAIVLKDWNNIVDAKRFVTALYDVFSERGGKIIQAEVSAFRGNLQTIEGVDLTSGQFLQADQFVLSAGAWSKQLLAPLGLKLCLEGVIGYQTLVEDYDFEMKHAVIYAKGGFGITPYESGIAISGSIEFAGLKAKANWRRADILFEKARRVLPQLKSGGGKRFMGRRPLTPDTLPILGRAIPGSNLLLATGHGQLGVTLAPITGKLIAQTASGYQTDIDLSPYSAARFN